MKTTIKKTLNKKLSTALLCLCLCTTLSANNIIQFEGAIKENNQAAKPLEGTQAISLRLMDKNKTQLDLITKIVDFKNHGEFVFTLNNQDIKKHKDKLKKANYFQFVQANASGQGFKAQTATKEILMAAKAFTAENINDETKTELLTQSSIVITNNKTLTVSNNGTLNIAGIEFKRLNSNNFKVINNELSLGQAGTFGNNITADSLNTTESLVANKKIVIAKDSSTQTNQSIPLTIQPLGTTSTPLLKITTNKNSTDSVVFNGADVTINNGKLNVDAISFKNLATFNTGLINLTLSKDNGLTIHKAKTGNNAQQESSITFSHIGTTLTTSNVGSGKPNWKALDVRAVKTQNGTEYSAEQIEYTINFLKTKYGTAFTNSFPTN
eukprot:COSAG01_NODE_118_length_25424_cov_2255.533641_2_plen_382_part_00